MNHKTSDRVATIRLTRTMRPRRSRPFAIAAVLSVLVTGSILGTSTTASATDYPSWQDVQNARSSVAAAQKEIANLKSLLSGLQANVTSTQAAATDLGNKAQIAQTNYDEKSQSAAALQQQADAARAKADQSKEQAGELAAQIATSGSGTDLSTTLFFSGGKADSMLSKLGLANLVKDQSAGIYEKAIQDQNSAQAMTDQANVARDALKTLANQAQKASDDAVAASAAANAALAAQQANEATMEAQLATLVTNQTHTEAEYEAGVQAQLAASAAAGAGSGGVAAAALGAGQISSAGWARPAGGQITSPYGYRLDPFTHIYALHSGTDLGASCNSPIYAAHSGTVAYAGPYGGYGNFVKIMNDDGTNEGTGYGHIVNGGILVHVGEQVSVGQNIARVGSTGWSTGCHLHFEVYVNGLTVDPVPFMRAHGVELAN